MSKFFIWFLFVSASLRASSYISDIDRISVEQGLSQSQVSSVVQDQLGFMWFGTQDGLNRYNGHEFKKFKRKPFDENSLSNETIFSLLADQKETLWVGTFNGLNRINTHSLQVERVEITAGMPILGLGISGEEDIYFASLDGVWHLDFKVPTTPIKSLISKWEGFKRIKNLEKKIILSYENNLYQILPGSEKPILIHHFDEPIIDFAFDKKGEIFVLSTRHIYFKQDDKVGYQKFEFLDNSVHYNRIYFDGQNVLWVGTVEHGVFQLDKNFQVVKNVNLSNTASNVSNSRVTFLYEGAEENEDVLWIGTSESGVYKYSRSKNAFTLLDRASSKEGSMSYYAIAQNADKTLWLGSMKGLMKIKPDHSIQYFDVYKKEESSNEILSILFDHGENMWVGTNGGLYVKKGSVFTHFPIKPGTRNQQPSILKIFEDRDQNLWICTSSYLARIKDQKLVEIIDTVSISGAQVSIGTVGDMVQDADGNFILGTSKGIFIRYKNGSWEHLIHEVKNRNSLMDDAILGIVIDRKTNIWACTFQGLTKIVKKKNAYDFVHYTENEGLPNSVVYGGLEGADGNLWFSTNKGLTCYDVVKNTFQNYEANDGLGINEFNSGSFYQNKEGQMFFGGVGDVIQFNPSSISRNLHLPKTTISSFKIDGKEQAIDSLVYGNFKVVIKPGQHFLSFKLAALDYTNPEKNQYAYMLKELNDEWIYLEDQRDINFANLPYGEYQLLVKSANNQGVWNDQELLRLDIDIETPWWRKSWFYFGLGLLGFGIALGLYYLRVNYLLTLEKTKVEENDRVRKLAAQDIHDEFGNSLTRISILSELVKKNIDKRNFQEAESLLTKIADNSQKLYQGTKDFIWAINSEHDNLYEVAIRIKDYCEEVLDKNSVRFDCKGINENLKEIKLKPGISRQIVMIFKEGITNTLKHSQTETVMLSFDQELERSYIIWQDLGIGIANDSKEGQGMSNMKNRAANINAILEINSGNEGTKISLGI